MSIKELRAQNFPLNTFKYLQILERRKKRPFSPIGKAVFLLPRGADIESHLDTTDENTESDEAGVEEEPHGQEPSPLPEAPTLADQCRGSPNSANQETEVSRMIRPKSVEPESPNTGLSGATSTEVRVDVG